ncbi:hypothetical protein V6Z12_1Z009000 [Gossypium hirsutum]
MASQVPQILASPISCNMENRPKADFHPGIWGDVFLNCPDKDIDITTQLHYEELKEEVRRMVVAPMDTSIRKLPLIDAVQRLGVNYHFEKEIEDALEAIYHDNNEADNDLHTTSLRFRLLREHGFDVSCEAFYKFKDEERNFKSSLTNDVQGLLELYEASYMRVHGEDILDEAISFTTTHLTLADATLDYPLSEQITHVLKQSIRRGLARVEARRYISIYQDIESHNKALLEFAKIDFNLLQLLHRKELSEICRWWKDLDFTRKLPFARDRVVEGYFWIMGVYFEPQYSLGRKMMTKVIAMAFIVDDTYDELIPYTDAIERWDNKFMDQLPEFMKISYKALLDVYEEMDQLMTEQRRQYRMIQLAQAYLLEVKWTHQNYKPTFEEFMDDIAEHKFKHRREDDCSAIECYMEQYGRSSWKEINKEFLKPTEMPIPVLNRSLNLARVMDVLYREGDGYTHVGKAAKGGITSLLIEPDPL